MGATYKMIYLDHAATTAVYPEVIREMTPYLHDYYYNPSSSYKEGRLLHKKLDQIRTVLAGGIHAKPQEIIFTSGGTESDNWVLVNAARSLCGKGRHIITSAIEHHAILHTCHFLENCGFDLTYLPVNREGFVEPAVLEKAIRPDTILISVMYANNEIGTLQPIRELGQIAQKNSILFHTDAVQAYAHVPIDVSSTPIDFLSVSAHKFGGPKGVGFLYAKGNASVSSVIRWCPGTGQKSRHRKCCRYRWYGMCCAAFSGAYDRICRTGIFPSGSPDAPDSVRNPYDKTKRQQPKTPAGQFKCQLLWY